VQTLAPTVVYMPAMHTGQVGAPVLDWYWPGEQLVHDVAAEAEYVPTSQLRQWTTRDEPVPAT